MICAATERRLVRENRQAVTAAWIGGLTAASGMGGKPIPLDRFLPPDPIRRQSPAQIWAALVAHARKPDKEVRT